MARTIQNLAKRFSKFLITHNRNNGKRFIKPHEDAPEALLTLIYEAHDEMLPDDYRYKFVEEALTALADFENPDEALQAIEPDVYTPNLTAWLHSHPNRVSYLEEAQHTYGEILDGFKLLATAQLLEKIEVFYSVLASFETILEEED